MSKFSNYVDNIKDQTKRLRDNLTNASGIDCSKKTIGECATIVEDYIKPENRTDELYVTPDWYPNIEEIILKAPDIYAGSRTYRPSYIVLAKNSENITPFYTSSSSSSSALNHGRGTGSGAVLCSDKCDNDIKNANADLLEIGSSIEHVWDVAKDIYDPSGESDYGVRWYIIYTTNTNNAMATYIRDEGDATKLEQVLHQYTSGYWTTASGQQYGSPSLKKLTYTDSFKFSPSSSSGTARSTVFRKLRKLVFKNETAMKTQIITCDEIVYDLPAGSAVAYSMSSKYATFPSGVTSLSNFNTSSKMFDVPDTVKNITGCFSSNSTLRKLTLPSGLLSISGGLTYMYALERLKIPSTVESWTNTSQYTLAFVPYVELYDDFDISGLNLTAYFNSIYIPKDIAWLKDLCKWLKDKTGEDSNTMAIGPINIRNAQGIWLTFNPNDKRDITWVPEGTENAINVVQFITEQLNWTLS